MIEPIHIASALCLWGGGLVYLLRRQLQINPIPWLIWGVASIIASLNTAVSDGLTQQVYIYAGGGLIFLAVAAKHYKYSSWDKVPLWQKQALPLLLISPLVSIWTSPTMGIALQIGFSWITAATFMQTAVSGVSRDPLIAWWIELTGCVLLLYANKLESTSWLLPLNSALVTVACIASIYLGLHTKSNR